MHAVIFANGTSEIPNNKIDWIKNSNLIVAADNGAKYCRELAIVPTALIGDLDSVSEDVIDYYQTENVIIIQASPKKDETDLELAMLYAKEQGATAFHVFGALGGRTDMMLTNLLLCMHPTFQDIEMIFYSATEEIFLIRENKSFENQNRKMISLFPLKEDVHGVKSVGLEYVLDDELMQFGLPRGVSNRIISDDAFVSIKSGILVCILFEE